jgi:hypothetical protein
MGFTTDPTTGELLDEFGNPVGPSSGGAGSVLTNPGLSGAGGGPGLATDPGYVAPDLPAAPPRPVAPPMGGIAPPLPGLPPLPAAAGGMVRQSSQTTSTSETKEEKRLRAEQKGARTEYENATEKLNKPTDKERELLGRTNAQNTAAADDAMATEEARKAASDAALAERDRLTKERNDKIAQVQAASEAEKQKYAGMKVRDYFGPGGEGEGNKGGILLGIALSGIGAAIARKGGGNQALDQLNLNIDRFRKSEQMRIEKQAEAVKMAGASVEDAERQKAAALHDLDARTAAVRETIAQEARTKAAARGLSVAQIENDSNVQKLDKAALTADQERQRRAMEYVDKDLAHAATLRSKTVTTNVHQEGGGRGATSGGANDAGDVFDAQGNLLGRVTNGRGGAQAFMTRDADYSRAQAQLEALRKDIETNGERVFGGDAIKRRQSLLHDAKIAVATVSPLGKTNEAMEQEGGSIGANHGLIGGMIVGDNPEAVTSKIKQLKEQQHLYRQQGLIPVEGGKSVAPTTSIPKGAGPSAPEPAPDRIAMKAQLIKASSAQTGETKTLSDGRKVRKVGANQWEVVSD